MGGGSEIGGIERKKKKKGWNRTDPTLQKEKRRIVPKILQDWGGRDLSRTDDTTEKTKEKQGGVSKKISYPLINMLAEGRSTKTQVKKEKEKRRCQKQGGF